MMEQCVISVIIPVYKAEKYLSRCIASLLAQSFTAFELLLIDDGSPDNSGKICHDWAERDCRIRVLHQTMQVSVRPATRGWMKRKERISFLSIRTIM